MSLCFLLFVSLLDLRFAVSCVCQYECIFFLSLLALSPHPHSMCRSLNIFLCGNGIFVLIYRGRLTHGCLSRYNFALTKKN